VSLPLDAQTLDDFLRASQPEKWARLVTWMRRTPRTGNRRFSRKPAKAQSRKRANGESHASVYSMGEKKSRVQIPNPRIFSTTRNMTKNLAERVGTGIAVGQAFQPDTLKSQAGKPDLRKVLVV
jgi:hypothetical protein